MTALPATPAPTSFTEALPGFDYRGFAAELDALRAELERNAGPADVAHLRKLSAWGRLATALGYATAWIAPNPVSAGLIALGSTLRWTIVAHHTSHRGLDRIPGGHLTSRTFAKGWRRYPDWFDWIDPEAWDFEHNRLHHYHTGEVGDPDLPEEQLERLRLAPLPAAVKLGALFALASTWKFVYYAPNTLAMLKEEQRRKAERRPIDPGARHTGVSLAHAWSPLHADGRAFWTRCILPFALLQFVLIPSLYLVIGPWAALSVLVNSLLAEWLSNLHTFAVIVPNHAGDDVHRFDRASTDRAEFYVRQVLGSVNFRTGGETLAGDVNDALHGFLNYQVEHHLWPDLSPLQYKRAAPRVKALCAKYGVPYVQEPLWKRLLQLVRTATGSATMVRSCTLGRDERERTAGGLRASGDSE